MKAWLFLVLLLIVLSCEAGKKKKKKKPSSGGSARDRFLRRTAKPPPTPSPTPAPVKVPKDFDFKAINSTDQFYEIFKLPRLPQHRQTGSKPPGKDHSTAVDLSDNSWFCHLGKQLVELPTPAYGNGFYFPACAWVNRCIGCCSGLSADLITCKPLSVKKKKVDFYHIRLPAFHGDDLLHQEKSIWLEEHVGCACACVESPDSCDLQRQYWHPGHCKCECLSDHQEHNLPQGSCPAKFHYDEKTCQCVCKTAPRECGDINKVAWSDKECDCACIDPEGKRCPSRSRDPVTCDCVQARG